MNWKNLDSIAAFEKLSALKGHVNLQEAMAGENGAERVRKYSVPMAAGLTYHYAAKQVDDEILDALQALADEAELTQKYAELYNGAVINTGEKRLVLHQLTRGQLGGPVIADGVDKRAFYTGEQKKAADFADKVHAGEITNEKGEKFTTVVQIGIGGSDLGPRAMYLALENWAKATGHFNMEARFISNVDPDDAASVLNSIDVEDAMRWLTTDSILSDPYIRRKTETMNYRVNTEPLPGIKIDFTGNRSYAENQQHYFRYNELTNNFDVFTPTNNGNFSMSYFMAGTAFVTSDSTSSRLFDNLMENRKIIAERIARNNPQWIDQVNEYTFDSIAGDYFPKGYGSGSMDVLLYSFIAAYTGKDPNTMSLNPFPRFPCPRRGLCTGGYCLENRASGALPPHSAR